MSYRLVALDLDGTLLDSGLAIRPESVDAIDEARRQGVEVMLVTGRHHVVTAPYHAQLGLDTPAICCNGTYLYDFGAQRASLGNPLSRTQALLLLQRIRERGILALMYVENAMTFEVTEPHLARMLAWAESFPPAERPALRRIANFEDEAIRARTIWKFVVTHPMREPLRTFIAEIEREMGLSCEWTDENRVDIAQSGNSKGALLAQWIESQAIAASQVVAFGDNFNDISMLRLAGLGVAMGNSDPEVQQSADWVAGSHDSSAIADTLRRFVLKGSPT